MTLTDTEKSHVVYWLGKASNSDDYVVKKTLEIPRIGTKIPDHQIVMWTKDRFTLLTAEKYTSVAQLSTVSFKLEFGKYEIIAKKHPNFNLMDLADKTRMSYKMLECSPKTEKSYDFDCTIAPNDAGLYFYEYSFNPNIEAGKQPISVIKLLREFKLNPKYKVKTWSAGKENFAIEIEPRDYTTIPEKRD